jgi:hypothetical protein
MVPSARNIGRALLLSLLVHAALVLVLCLFRGPAPRETNNFGVIDTGPGVSLSLLDPPQPRKAALPNGGEEQQEHEREFEVVVHDAPASSSATEAGIAPVVVGLPPGSRFSAGRATSTAGSGASGGQRSLLETPAAARSVVYLLDRSLSMGPSGALARARRELLASLSRLAPGTAFQVILYNRQALPLRIDGRSGYLIADDATRAAVARELDQVAAAGNTDHVAALRMGLRMRPDVLFLVTDADDLNDREVREMTALNDRHTTIYTVELSRGKEADGPLRHLAVLNGGTHRRVPPAQ